MRKSALIGPHFVVFFRASFEDVRRDGLAAHGACYFDSRHFLAAAIEKEPPPDCRHWMQREFQHHKAQFLIHFYNRSLAACNWKDYRVFIGFVAIRSRGILGVRPNGLPLNRRFWRRSLRIPASAP